jgi:hypothetical protein
MPINLSTLVNQTNPLQLCKAWVNFNGTGTIGQPQTIRSSYNVSSVTKNATGDYTVNFATAMTDANYSVMGITQATGTGTVTNVGSVGIKPSTTPSTSSVNVVSGLYNAYSDQTGVHISIFGN